MTPLADLATRALNRRKTQGLLRDQRARIVDGAAGARVTMDGVRLSNFASNAYLGLGTHPRVIAAAREAAEQSGTSSAASRLVLGNHRLHLRLEERLRSLKNTEAALVMSSGYQANIGVLSALGHQLGDIPVVLSDELNHASIIDGARLSKAKVEVYAHTDMADLERRLARHRRTRTLVVTESRFSMDGDLAPLEDIAVLCEQYGAALIVDEAHSTGVDGNGRGLCHQLGIRPDVIVGTLGKALGAHGAFVAATQPVVNWIANAARSFVYTTALPPMVAAAALAALDVLADERPNNALWENIERVRQALQEQDLWSRIAQRADGPIIPIRCGTPERAMDIARRLREDRVLAVPIRPPTVPEGTSRVRITVRADHDVADLARLIHSLEKLNDYGPDTHRPGPPALVAPLHPPRPVGV